MKKIKKNSKVIKLSNEEKKKNEIHEKIEKIFKNSGFTSLKVEKKEFDIGGRKAELDHCFVYENIILIVEQTVSKNDVQDHMRNKNDTAEKIFKNKQQFIDFLKINFNSSIVSFPLNRYKIFYLYYAFEKKYDEGDEKKYPYMKVISNSTFNYFEKMSSVIKKSFRFEIFRFLKIDKKDIGISTSGSSIPVASDIAILYPETVSGNTDGVRFVSFMVSPMDLIGKAYVMRKDSWEENVGLYQRLITPKRITDIRTFVVKEKKMFLNNIIVSLPKDLKFTNENGDPVDQNDIDNYENLKLTINSGFNSICIIDGQHRVYAYYEDIENNESERLISVLREQHNLLVTGIIFPNDWDEVQRRDYESNVFLEINNNTKGVEKDLRIHIESLKDPFSGIAIARKVLEKLNDDSVFKDMFQLSLVETAPIKVASIMQFALSSLVEPDLNANGFYKYWVPTNGFIKTNKMDFEQLKEYINYCYSSLKIFFSAVKCRFIDYWNDKNAKILKVVSINGFIIAFHKSLDLTTGPQDFEYYKTILENLDVDFSKNVFPYSGSTYNKFAEEKIIPIFLKNDK